MLDLAANADVFTKKACDTTIELSPDPVGLVVREAVFAPGDAHCCPSSTKISVLTFERVGMDGLLLDGATDLTPRQSCLTSRLKAGYIQSLG